MQLPFLSIRTMARNRGFTFIETKRRVSRETVGQILGTLFYCIAAILLAAVLVVSFGMRVSMIGSSMRPTLENGQVVLVDRFMFKLTHPDRFDVVCFYPKGNENTHIYIKRIIGLPGETIQIKEGYVYVNGVRLIEDETYDLILDPGLFDVEFKMGDDEYFVLGDNRNNSEDSRIGNIGAVTTDMMLGKAWFKLSGNDNRAGFVK